MRTFKNKNRQQKSSFYTCHLIPRLRGTPVNTKHLYNIYTTSAQRLRNVLDVGPTLYKCYIWNTAFAHRDWLYH